MNYFFVRKYATHAESWMVTTDIPAKTNIPTIYWPTADAGLMFIVHSFYRTDAEAYDDFHNWEGVLTELDDIVELVEL